MPQNLFVYFSELHGRRVVDQHNRYVGKIADLCMMQKDEVFPRAMSVILECGLFPTKFAQISISDITISDKRFRLKASRTQVKYQRDPIRCEFSLIRDILDQQIVDTNDRKVVRVNDIHLLAVDGQIYLAHVDVGLRGIIRRLGWSALIDAVVKVFAPKAAYLKEEEFIPWKFTHVLAFASGNVIRSEMARSKLARIPAAELADIMEELNITEKMSLFKTFNVDMQRRIFTDMVPTEKIELIEQLPDQEAANLLENIPADEATDFLTKLDPDRRLNLLRCMHSQTSKALRKLLGFARDSAGGLMTTEYLWLPPEAKVKDAIDLIKLNVNYPGSILYIYLIDDKSRLVGVTSFRRFFNEDPQRPLIETCFPAKIFVRTNADMEEIAILLEKHSFFALPVLDNNDVLQGVITSDDVMEELISLTWTKYKDQL